MAENVEAGEGIPLDLQLAGHVGDKIKLAIEVGDGEAFFEGL